MKISSAVKATVFGACLLAAPAAHATSVATDLGIATSVGSYFLSTLTSYQSFLTALQTSLSTNGYSVVYGYFGGNSTVTGVSSSGPWYSSLVFSGSTVSSNGYLVNTVTNTVSAIPTVSSVPAPIVGAGLPVLAALGGFAAWRRRRVASAA